MPDVRRYIFGLLYRTSVCGCLFLLCYIMHRLWPELFERLREGLFYPVNYAGVVHTLKELGEQVLPG